MKNDDFGVSSNLARRKFMSLMGSAPFVLSGSSLLGLTACGGGSTTDTPVPTPVTTPVVTKVTFNGMANPATDANRAAVFTNATFDITYADGSVKAAQALSYKTIYTTGTAMKTPDGGDVLSGGFYLPDGITPINDTSTATAEQFYSDCIDGTSLLKLDNPTVTGITGNTVFAVTQFEYKTSNNAGTSMYGALPAPIAVATLDQDKITGALAIKKYYNIPTAAIHGLWIPCAGSLSPWNTHLSSEEYEPDAWYVKTRRDGTSLPALAAYTATVLTTINGNLDYFQAFSTNTFGNAAIANPYHYGHVPEVTVKPDGTASIKKHYCMGRISRELVQVMPDNKTVLMGDDYTNGGVFMFIADVAKNLSSGTLYVAKMTQTNAAQSVDGGTFTIAWIKLGSATSVEIEALANSKTVDQIIDVVFATTEGYAPVSLDGLPTQYVKVVPGMEKAAAFLETHRYAGIMGATMEFTKLEGVALNAKDKIAYFAMSRLEKCMADATGVTQHISVKKVSAGAVYAVQLTDKQNDTTATAINSAWVPVSMAVPVVATPYAGNLIGEDITADADGNTGNVDRIANPDNVKFSETMRTLYIGEDSGQHLNNCVWAFNVDTKKLSRILTVPAGAECTGLQTVDNLNGFAYVMSGFQHPGDWTFKTPSQDALKAAVIANYGPSTPAIQPAPSTVIRTLARKAAIGYISGLPVIG
jgi:secreted PhoX family phosphatase